MNKKSESFYQFDDRFDFEENPMSSISIDPPCIAEYGDREKKDKYRFEADHYIVAMIKNFLKSPPSGSYFETEWNEYEGSSELIPFASVYYTYNPKLKRHLNYARKVEKLIYSDLFNRRYEKDFEKEFRKFKKSLQD